MSVPIDQLPLGGFPYRRTDSLDEACNAYASLHVPVVAEPLGARKAFSWEANRVVVDRIALLATRYGGALRCTSPSSGDGFSLDLTRTGEGLLSIAPTVRHKQWMKDAWNAIKDRPLWQIAMVGAHDAGSYGLWWDGVVEHAIVALKSGSKTQGASLYRQLEFGIRYFDLRFFSPRGGEPDLSRWHITRSRRCARRRRVLSDHATR